MTTRSLSLLVMIFLSMECIIAAQPIDSLFTAAQEAYRSGDYSSALEAYETIVRGGEVSAAVYFNLGNTYFRTGNVARSILAYERAYRLDPTDVDLRHNLELARIRTIDRIEPLPELFIRTWARWLNASLPVGITVGTFLAGWCMIFVSLITMYLVRSSAIVRITRLSFFLGVIISLVVGLVLILQVFVIPRTTDGIIITPTVTVKSSPDPASVDAFVIHEGLKVVLGDSVENWRRITLADGKTGWIPTSQVEAI